MPEIIKPFRAFFWCADNNHFLLFKLVDTVYAAFFYAMRAFFLAEAGGIACQRLRQVFLFIHSVDEFANHGVFARADEVEVFSLDFVHHSVHFCETHNACNDIAANHKRRDTVFEAAANHEIARVRQNCGMEPCDIAHEVIEAVAGNFPCAFQVDAVETFHDIRMVGDFKIRHNRLAEFFDFNVFAVIFTDGYGGVDDIGNRHHNDFNTFLNLFFAYSQAVNAFCFCGYLRFYFFGFLFLALCH